MEMRTRTEPPSGSLLAPVSDPASIPSTNKLYPAYLHGKVTSTQMESGKDKLQ